MANTKTAQTAPPVDAPAVDTTEDAKRTRKLYAPITADDFIAEVADASMTALLAPTRERDGKPDPVQDKIDATVKKALDAWKLEADGERSFAVLLTKRLVALNRVSPDKVETIKFKIRKAGTRVGATIRFGEAGKLDDKGNELVAYAVMTKLPAKPRAKRTK